VEEGVEGAELTAGFVEGVGDSGEAAEFGVDEFIDHRDGWAFVDFIGGFLAFDEVVGRGPEVGGEVGGPDVCAIFFPASRALADPVGIPPEARRCVFLFLRARNRRRCDEPFRRGR
jgi:hypothetical protein